MAVCYFDYNYKTKYNCEYEKTDDGIEVTLDYDVMEEIPTVNGVRSFGKNTEIKDRDILIIDNKSKMNYLLKKAYCIGTSVVWGTPDGGSKTKFLSNNYLYNADYEKLSSLDEKIQLSKIRIYSKLINKIIGTPSLFEDTIENEFIIKLQKKANVKNIEIKANNIKQILISDDWKHIHDYKKGNINIDLNGYIEIELEKDIDYEDIYEYITELEVFLQLLQPNRLDINKIMIYVEDKYYGINIPKRELTYKDKKIKNTVEDDILNFLEKCYKIIPYRNSKSEIRNISHVILNESRNLEDNFLMMYRFVECYYKNNGEKDFISYGLQNNYKETLNCSIEDMTAKIISLRNHYVHNGYYIDNERLEICYKKKNKKKNPKDYIENNVNFEWIYEKTEILYKIVIDIILYSMLGYSKYNFDKHF